MWKRRRSSSEEFLDAGGGSREEVDRLLAEEDRILAAEMIRGQDEIVRLAERRIASTRSPRLTDDRYYAEQTVLLARKQLTQLLSKHPELSDRGLVRRLAPTRWERLRAALFSRR